ncbi:MAG: response regulator [Burkholderiales bacterium]|nr:response regulator [Burkholderiales bacterium]
MRVLIVDDEDLRGLLAHYLKQEWPDIEVGELDSLVHDMPDERFPLGDYALIILDYMLGRGDGLEWLAAFKRRPDCPPVLFLTGAGNESVAVHAMKAGADGYQRKQELTRERLVMAVREGSSEQVPVNRV